HAAIGLLPPEYIEHYHSRALVATEGDTFRQLSDSITPLILITTDSDPGLVRSLVKKGHFLCTIGSSNSLVSENAIRLPRASFDEFEKALEACGLEPERASSITRESARSLVILQRLIPAGPGVPQP